jgi:hypothetical protein
MGLRSSEKAGNGFDMGFAERNQSISLLDLFHVVVLLVSYSIGIGFRRPHKATSNFFVKSLTLIHSPEFWLSKNFAIFH